MSKDIIIQQSGEPTTLSNISRIETPKNGGGTVGWIESDYVITNKKEITKNGTYKASSDNLYGYDKVIVKVPKKGKKKTGKRPQSSGDPNDYTVTTDDDGNLVYTKIPTSINIVNPPSKTVYSEGELIKKQGMLVKAYFADGGLWGDVPLGEIQLDPTTAQSSGEYEEYSDGNGLNCIKPTLMPIVGGIEPNVWTAYAVIPQVYSYNGQAQTIAFGSQDIDVLLTKTTDGILAMALKTQGSNRNILLVQQGEGGYWENWGSSGPHDLAKYWYVGIFADQNRQVVGGIPTSTNLSNSAIDNLHPIGGSSEITASWNRPDDGKTLTDAFSIRVTS